MSKKKEKVIVDESEIQRLYNEMLCAKELGVFDASLYVRLRNALKGTPHRKKLKISREKIKLESSSWLYAALTESFLENQPEALQKLAAEEVLSRRANLKSVLHLIGRASPESIVCESDCLEISDNDGKTRLGFFGFFKFSGKEYFSGIRIDDPCKLSPATALDKKWPNFIVALTKGEETRYFLSKCPSRRESELPRTPTPIFTYMPR